MIASGNPKMKRPFGIIILILLQIISAIQFLLSGLYYFILSALVNEPLIYERLTASFSRWFAENADTLFFFLGIIFLTLFIFALILAWGYLKRKVWARRRGIGVAILAILLAVFSIIILPDRIDVGSPWWTVLFNLCVIFYLRRKRIRDYLKY